MAQKVNKPAAPIVITITLPDEDKLVRTGQLLIQRGAHATFGRFEYSSLEDIMAAIERGTTRLIQVEANPPDLKPALQASLPVARAAVQLPAADQAGEGAESSAETTEAPGTAEESSDQAPAEPAAAQRDQLQLF